MALTKCTFGLDPNSPVDANKDLGLKPTEWGEGRVETSQEREEEVRPPLLPLSCVSLEL